MLNWYRELIRLRRSTPSLNNGEPGNTVVTFNEEERWLCTARGSVVIACNLGSDSRPLPVIDGGKLILASRPDIVGEDGTIALPPDSVAILRTDAIH